MTMNKSLLKFAAGLAATIVTSLTSATPLTFNFSGSVSSIISNDSSGTFGANFAVGDAVTGNWAFDTTAADNVLIPGQVHYYDATFSATISGKTFTGPAQYRIFNDHSSGFDGFSIINESSSYTGPALGPLTPRTFFIQYVGMPATTLSDFSLITDPISLIPLSAPAAPHGLRLDNPDGTFGGLYFTIDRVTTVPEPATYVILLAGLGIITFITRRRNCR
jgi:hypothetical protein